MSDLIFYLIAVVVGILCGLGIGILFMRAAIRDAIGKRLF